MAELNMKKVAFTNGIWKIMERIFAQGITMVVSIILARLLSPDDYGVISVVLIFFSFADILISGGFTTALVQKKEVDNVDYSTIFLTSIVSSIIFYIFLFFTAPYIAKLYRIPILVPVFRIMGLSLPISAIKSIYCAYVSRNMQFKTFFYATLIGTIISAVVGIGMAYKGFGVWSLVAQQMTNLIIDTFILSIVTKFYFKIRFSFSKFKQMFRYAYKILLSNFIGQVYVQMIPSFIGIKYTTSDLSFYTKGKMFPSALFATINNSLSAVLFPIISRTQDNLQIVLGYTRRFIKVVSFIVFPALLGLFAISDSFIVVLLTEKWAQTSFFMKIFCISIMFAVVDAGYCEIIKGIGRSDVYFRMELFKKVGFFITILLFLIFSNSPKELVFSEIIFTIIQLVVNSIPVKKLLNYRFRDQILDLIPNLLISIVMCVIVILVGQLKLNIYLLLFLQIIVGIITYLGLSFLFNKDNFNYLLDLLKQIVFKK